MLATSHPSDDAGRSLASRGGKGRSRLRVIALAGLLAALALCAIASAAFATLPEKRAYELVSPPETNGDIGNAYISTDGEKVDLEGEPFGNAVVGGQNVYQAQRTSTGWQSTAITPKSTVEEKFYQQTAPLIFSSDLTRSIYTTAQPLDEHDKDGEALDLYEVTTPGGAVEWISQGPQSGEGPPAGTLPSEVTLSGASDDGRNVVFNTFESLTPNATGIEGNVYEEHEYLYNRDLNTGQTHLVNVNDNNELLSPEGAVLGNGLYLTMGEGRPFQFLPADLQGTTTNAVSEDGSKIFFESPTPGVGAYQLLLFPKHTHLYMREDDSRTVQLDAGGAEPEGESRYMGASQNGSEVFFTSNEELGGDEFKDHELYVYDTLTETVTPISIVPSGSTPEAASVYGVTAISNDGSHVYYVAKGVLANNTNEQGEAALVGEQNFYVYDTETHTNTFIARLGLPEVEPYEADIGKLVSYLDLERPAVPTPNGNVLAFSSEQNLTGEDPNSTTQVYRYEASTGQLLCVSCDPSATGSSTMSISREGGSTIAGGTYDPPGHSAPMDENGDTIIFNTENALVPEDQNTNAPPAIAYFGELREEAPRNIDPYEWHDGHRYLLSNGQPSFSGIQGITPSGRDILIYTTNQLTKANTDGYSSVYDVRVDGGFPETEPAKTPCSSEESCHGEVEGNPLFQAPGSATLAVLPESVPPPEVQSAPKLTSPIKPKPKPKKKAKKKKKKQTKKKKKQAKGKKSSRARSKR